MRCDSPPECGDSGQQIGQRDTSAQRDDRQDDAHSRLPQGAIQAIEQEQTADAAVKRAFNAQIPHTFPDDLGFSGIHKNRHKQLGESENECGYDHAEGCGNAHGAFQPGAYPCTFFRAVILRNECGKGVAKILHRHIGEGVDLHSGSKGRHDNGAEAVDKSLHHKDTEIHDRLLNTGQRGKGNDFADAASPQAAEIAYRTHLREAHKRVNGDTDARKILGNYRCFRSTGDTPV